MIYVALSFHPRQANPARKSGRGVWRIVHCGRIPTRIAPQVGEGRLLLIADRVYKAGSRVDPAKVALRGLWSQ